MIRFDRKHGSERKLGWDDRLIGTMRLALSSVVEPKCFATGAVAALCFLETDISSGEIGDVLRALWCNDSDTDDEEMRNVIRVLEVAHDNEKMGKRP
jgi:hypothetical protein